MTWLDELKVGDKVIEHTRWNRYVKTVTKTNKIHIFCDKQKFIRSSGRLSTKDKWNRSLIGEATPEVIDTINAEIEKKELVGSVEKYKIGKLSTDQLKRILAICEEKGAPE